MTNYHKFYLLLLLLSFFVACNQPSQDPKSTTVFVYEDKNGLVQTYAKEEINYVAQYLPLSSQVLKEVDFNRKDSIAIKKAIEELEGNHYLLLKIRPNRAGQSLETIYTKKQTTKKWSEVIFELNFQLQKQFVLWQKTAAKTCQLYHVFPGIKPADGLQFILLFSDEEAIINQSFDTDIVLEFKDNHFLNEKIAFTFSKSNLNRIPKLEL